MDAPGQSPALAGRVLEAVEQQCLMLARMLPDGAMAASNSLVVTSIRRVSVMHQIQYSLNLRYST